MLLLIARVVLNSCSHDVVISDLNIQISNGSLFLQERKCPKCVLRIKQKCFGSRQALDRSPPLRRYYVSIEGGEAYDVVSSAMMQCIRCKILRRLRIHSRPRNLTVAHRLTLLLTRVG